MRIEDIDIVEAEPLEAGVQGSKKIFWVAKFSLWPGPHAVSNLRGNKQFIPVL